jgi:EXLDI family protein
MYMPTKNVYVSDADLPLFEKAAELAGALSTAVAAGLRLYVAQCERETRKMAMQTIEVEVNDGPVVSVKRFVGRKILRYEERSGLRTTTFRVYLTAKNQYAIYQRNDPDWGTLSNTEGTGPGWEDAETWQGDWWHSKERSLQVFPNLDSMKGHMPSELIAALTQTQQQPAVEELDI